MLKQKKNLCIFIHFSEQNKIPYCVQIFVNELASFFDEVVLLSNIKVLESTPVLSNNISLEFQENKGYDFGRFYTYYRTINRNNYNRIACINDSNFLINTLDKILIWDQIDSFDLWGIVDSYEKPWFSTHKFNHHIQSHFLVLNNKAINLLDEYFESVKINDLLNEKNQKKLRRKVINDWEIGLTQFMKSKGLKIGHYLNSKEITKQFNIPLDSNISHVLYKELLLNGYPLVKKKAFLEESLRSNKDELNCCELIKKLGKPDWNLNTLIDELGQMKNSQKEVMRSGLVKKIILLLQHLFVNFDGKQR